MVTNHPATTEIGTKHPALAAKVGQQIAPSRLATVITTTTMAVGADVRIKVTTSLPATATATAEEEERE